MKFWKYYTIGSGLVLLSSYVLSNPLQFGICNRVYTFNNQTGCLDSLVWSVGQPLLIFSVATFLLLISFPFVRVSTFSSWLKFAFWWLPLSVIAIYIGSSGENGWAPYYKYSQVEVAILMASLFVFISLIIIVWKQFGQGGKTK